VAKGRGPLPWLGGLLALYLLGPIAALIGRLGPAAWTGLPTSGLAAALGVSALTATVSSAVIALLGIPLAWLLAQSRGRAWDFLGLAVQLPLALPPLMSGILLLEVVGPASPVGNLFGGRLTDTLAGIVLAQTFVASPFLIVAARSAFAAIDPGLDDVAATLGHRGWSRFRRVGLPLAGPGIRAGLLLAWLRAFGEFGATVILAYHPYSLPVFTFVQFTGTGLPATLAPTGSALGAAFVVLGLAHWRPGRWLWSKARADSSAPRPLPTPPSADRVQAPPPGPLTMDLDVTVGDFRLRVAHRADAAHLALLGPSGAGKSLTLRSLAGLLGPGVGQVRLGSRQLGPLLPERRHIGWVPQDAGLFPHLCVWEQLTFGTEADPALAAQWLRRLGLAGLEGRRPHQLSGGQRQRVALARALARSPDLILLDEPFSSLDSPVRNELRRELRSLQREAGVATVLVTHDPEEAALLADEVLVLAEGRVLQAGPRRSVFARPCSARVAHLLGVDNLGSGTWLGRGRLLVEGTEMTCPDLGLPYGTSVTWCVRAEQVVVDGTASSARGEDGKAGVVLDAADLGAWHEVVVRLDGGLQLTARTPASPNLAPGNRCRVAIPRAAVTLWADAAPATGAPSP
jgi:ABC-type sulfate/molybdate transport systems ATPase subunit/ABC-type sulfate transport system permease component